MREKITNIEECWEGKLWEEHYLVQLEEEWKRRADREANQARCVAQLAKQISLS